VWAVKKKNAGGVVLGEAESTCTIYGMPRAAFETGAIASEYPIYEMGHALVATAAGRLKNAA
jgi:two-component system chemotaxis response regulator CheB